MKIKLTIDKSGLVVMKMNDKEYRFIMTFSNDLLPSVEMLSTGLETLHLGDKIMIEFPDNCRLCARRFDKHD